MVLEVDEDSLPTLAPDPLMRDWLTRAAITSLAMVPLVVAGSLIGAVVLATAGDRRPYDGSDVPFLEDIAARAGAAIAHVRTVRRSHEVAVDLQRALLPASPPVFPDRAGGWALSRRRARRRGRRRLVGRRRHGWRPDGAGRRGRVGPRGPRGRCDGAGSGCHASHELRADGPAGRARGTRRTAGRTGHALGCASRSRLRASSQPCTASSSRAPRRCGSLAPVIRRRWSGCRTGRRTWRMSGRVRPSGCRWAAGAKCACRSRQVRQSRCSPTAWSSPGRKTSMKASLT